MKKTVIILLIIIVIISSFSCGPRRYKCGPYRKCEFNKNSTKQEIYKDIHKTHIV